MSTYTNSITNIVNSGYTGNYTSKQASQLTEILKTGMVDSVYFSDESKNLFQISQIDTMLDEIFGIPKDLTKEQKVQLDTLRKGLDAIYPNNYSFLEQIDFDKIFNNLNIKNENKDQIKNLTNELNLYLTEQSINKLFGNNENNLSFFSNSYSTILGEKLTNDETNQLGTLSLQLNRLLFSNDDNQLSSYLDVFNNLYGLNNPNKKDLFNATTLLTQRNTLLSSTLINRSYPSNYTF
jgi:hypothetical protein